MEITTEDELRKLYRDLLEDEEFDQIDLDLKTPNIFHILGISRAELKHSNFLAWLLDPNESHGLGRIFLTKFLRKLVASGIVENLDEFEIEDLNFNNVELRREWKNIDLLIIFDTHVICIENKFDSKEHSNQLVKYREIVGKNFEDKKQIFVYLTPTGSEEKPHYVTYSYVSIIEQIDTILRIHGTSLSSSVNQYISDYITTLKRELTMTDDVNALAARIYKRHKDLIEFVYKNKSDIPTELPPIFLEKVKKSGWIEKSSTKGVVRFLTKNLEPIIPIKQRGGTDFYFEIDYWWWDKKVVFRTIIYSKETTVREILCKALENTKGHQKPKGKDQIVHFRHDWTLDVKNMTEVNKEEITKVLDADWKKVVEIVNNVEEELIKYKNELQKFREN